ncbi:hypothetical protein E2C01_062746 [Portunus trituberculatus]|uniref:Uncharacterized protein n=1 Tax=Portunus trituberculatus TaxID=210409 RepID=A0A5B7HIW9_PORTR|nr:hypothetical protein [Portunus trituberculatus]
MTFLLTWGTHHALPTPGRIRSDVKTRLATHHTAQGSSHAAGFSAMCTVLDILIVIFNQQYRSVVNQLRNYYSEHG